MRRSKMTSLVSALAATLVLLVAAPVLAQDRTAAETNMQILRDKIRADKKLVVAANMELTDSEAKGFWPLYDAYQKDLAQVNERLARAIVSYADAYTNKTLTDELATKLNDEALAIEEREAAMRKDYSRKLASVLPARKAARYLQLENKIRAVLRYELAAQIPLVP